MEVNLLTFPFTFWSGIIRAMAKCFFFSILILAIGLKAVGTSSSPTKLLASSAGSSSHCSETTSIPTLETVEPMGSDTSNSGKNPFSGLLVNPETCKNFKLPFPGTNSVTDFCHSKLRCICFCETATNGKQRRSEERRVGKEC